MARKVFYSFHYNLDNWRTGQVRNSYLLEGNQLLSDNDWEQVKKGGDAAIQHWIDDQMTGRSCVVVLIGAQTAGRKWINYEIRKAWQDGRGVLGVHIHRLRDSAGELTSKGSNPFNAIVVNGVSLQSAVQVYDPQNTTSVGVYAHIRDNLPAWVEQAVKDRSGL